MRLTNTHSGATVLRTPYSLVEYLITVPVHADASD